MCNFLDKLLNVEKIYLIFLFFLIAKFAASQLNSDVHFEHYNARNGLMTNQVNDIFQDTNRIYLAVFKNGVFRYNGYNFKYFNLNYLNL